MAAKRKTNETMTDALRDAIAESELSFKALERETGVIRQSLMKFATGEQTIRLDAADKLADYFGLKVVQRKAK
ncbi:MAG TPA: helix-turn-helix transcriptional regulator [Pirellulaceae bacterium]|nr:helix-turn-helix transcriptional regulator [Pirellulaceae bacterium]